MTIEQVLELITFSPMTRVKINRYRDGYLTTVADSGRKGVKDIPLEITMRDVTAISIGLNTIVLEFNDD